MTASSSDLDLDLDLALLEDLVLDTVSEEAGPEARGLLAGLCQAATALRGGALDGGRPAFAGRVATLSLGELELAGRGTTLLFHLMNAAEEQHRIRMLRRRDHGEPIEGSVAAACRALAASGVTGDEMRALLGRMFVMPVLTAHPTEARRRTIRDHLAEVSVLLDGLDDPRAGVSRRAHLRGELRDVIGRLFVTDESRRVRPTPLDEIRAGLDVFHRTLLDATLEIYRELEDAVAAAWPGHDLAVPSFLRWGSWIGGDRDGNPNITSDVTRAALERQRQVVLGRHLTDVEALGRELSVSAGRAAGGQGLTELEASLEVDRQLLPELAARFDHAAEPFRSKLRFMHARLEQARSRGETGYADTRDYRADLALLDRALRACRLGRLADGRLRDARRRAEVFGFHLASLDVRQNSEVHEVAVAELLRGSGTVDYLTLPEAGRLQLLGHLLERADLSPPRDRDALSPVTRELLATLDVVGRARRDSGAEACERYVISFTALPSDVLEVLFLCRAARLAPDELRPVPLFEQLEDLERADVTVGHLLELRPVTTALRGELEAMIGYSDSSKQVGYTTSQIALARAQDRLARVADAHGLTLTVFHGRGGAVGRGGGPASRAIQAQPASALRGRLRVTEQGETITARYGRPEIARRDLDQMIGAVLVASSPRAAAEPPSLGDRGQRDATLDRAASAAGAAYGALLADRDRLIRYALAATPIREVAQLPIASRPAGRRAALSFDDLRAIPWVFSWNQSRHGLPGWFGLGSALEAVIASDGLERTRALYRDWPLFRALIDNAQMALVRADIDVAACYAQLADDDDRGLFELVRAEHGRTVARLHDVLHTDELLAEWPHLAQAVARRNPYVDVLSHVQIELLGRLSRAAEPAEQDRIRRALFVTINGIAAGLQTAG